MTQTARNHIARTVRNARRTQGAKYARVIVYPILIATATRTPS